jgi:hypothetical protein
MAKRKKDDEQKESPDKALLTRIRKRFKLMLEADDDNRRLGLEDMKFVNVPGEQWDPNMKKKRGKRPTYEFNKLRITCKRVINDMRANRPMGKVRAVEDGDKETAEIYEGLIRNIWNNSDGDTVIDYAGEYQVSSGMGAWRINTKYVAEDAFDQDIVVEAIPNPFCLFSDPAAKDLLKRDAQDWILTDRISKTAYETRWPDKEVIDWESTEFDDDDDWQDDDSVRIVEYWYKEAYDKELWQLVTGQVVDAASDEAKFIDPAQVKKKRVAKCNRIKMCIASGDSILEEADWAGSNHPFVVIYGEHMLIDGKTLWWGLPRFAKDAQRSYNVSRTAITETIAMTPQAKWWATVENAKGHADKWEQAIAENIPWLAFNPDSKTGGQPPQRMGGADVPMALIQESQMASEEIKAVTGIFDASLGQAAPEKSGRAIIARQQQGEIATFNYQDNMAKGIRRTWEILIDLAPKIYDTERELRILGSDGAEAYKTVNQVVVDPATQKMIKVNDLAQGRYDTTVTVGPSFSTKRQEASETYLQLAQASPEVMSVAGDLIFKAMDLPYSDDIADRLKAMLPPPIQQMLSEGKEIPPEAQAVMAQAKQAMEMVEQKNQLVMQAAQELQGQQQVVDKSKAEVQTLMANLETKKAQFDAHVATQMAKLTKEQAQLQVGDANLQVKDANFKASVAQVHAQSHQDSNANEREQLGSQVADALKVINEMAQQFAAQASQVLFQIQQAGSQPKPKIRAMKAKRVNGELIAEPIYDDAPVV